MKIAIINSRGFWSMGWTTDQQSQQDVLESLQRLGIETLAIEVASKSELVQQLSKLKADNWLVWPNAYQVSAFEGSDETLWLADIIDDMGLPMIGSPAHALKTVMQKDECQRVLEHHGVAIPAFAALEEADLDSLECLMHTRGLEFPLFVKPNALSTSKGIDEKSIVEDLTQLREQVSYLGSQFGYPVMVEEFLPGQDITVAVFTAPEQPVVLATYYDTDTYGDPDAVMDGAILDYDLRQKDWNDGKWLRVVEEPEILAQVEDVVIPACEAIGIQELTRIDCRMDRHGRLKAFDVNGLPGLELPFSTTVWQMIVKMQDQPEQLAFDTLLSLVVYCAAYRHQLTLPEQVQELAENYIGTTDYIEAAAETA